jgi:hypothetical protein
MRANGGAPNGVFQVSKNGFSMDFSAALADGRLAGVMLELFQVRDFRISHKRT